ncbi:MAG: hypothetical protein JKY67_13755 [Pseudomonadales bacterium]|nr:hypothetical protein [Pseudomonadales bacterium]
MGIYREMIDDGLFPFFKRIELLVDFLFDEDGKVLVVTISTVIIIIMLMVDTEEEMI